LFLDLSGATAHDSLVGRMSEGTFYALARAPVQSDDIATRLRSQILEDTKNERLDVDAAEAHAELDDLIKAKVPMIY